jgi:hypothetical protein
VKIATAPKITVLWVQHHVFRRKVNVLEIYIASTFRVEEYAEQERSRIRLKSELRWESVLSHA